jgi:hypothetical protein
LLDALTQPKSARDVFSVLFRRPISDAMLLQMATGESVAHLNCLIRRGRVTRKMDHSGINWYQAH